jgi:hypothetical protein
LAGQPLFCYADRIKTGLNKEYWLMNCPHCATTPAKARVKKTRLGYSTFFYPHCRSTFNERTGTPFNYLEFPTDIVLLAVLWRLRYKLSLRDVAEMFLTRGFPFTTANGVTSIGQLTKMGTWLILEQRQVFRQRLAALQAFLEAVS